MSTRSKIFTLIVSLLLVVLPAYGARDTDSFDGNIFPIYSGNGSLVPPQTTLSKSIQNNRTSVIVFYLDDNANSKAFAPVVSGIKLLWSNSIDLIPLTTDTIQDDISNNPKEESYYWHGNVPQIVVIDGKGDVILDEEGQVNIKDINKAIMTATGEKGPGYSIEIKTFNEYNSEPSKEGYNDPR